MSLKTMGQHGNMQEVYKAIESMIIIHNMCIDFNDHPQSIEGFTADNAGFPIEPSMNESFLQEVEEADINIPIYETDQWLKKEGYRKRMELLKYLFGNDEAEDEGSEGDEESEGDDMNE